MQPMGSPFAFMGSGGAPPYGAHPSQQFMFFNPAAAAAGMPVDGRNAPQMMWPGGPGMMMPFPMQQMPPGSSS